MLTLQLHLKPILQKLLLSMQWLIVIILIGPGNFDDCSQLHHPHLN